MNVQQDADRCYEIQHHVDGRYASLINQILCNALLCIMSVFRTLKTLSCMTNRHDMDRMYDKQPVTYAELELHAHQPMQCWHGLQVLLLLQSKLALNGF